MTKRYSIAQARHNLASIVHELEGQPVIELTRRGAPVAVLLSVETYYRLQSDRPSFWERYTAYRATFELATPGDEPDPFQGVRDSSAGREVQW